MGCKEDWEQTVIELSKNYYCLAIDLPGHGTTKISSGEKYYSIEATAEGIINFLKDLNFNNNYLIGYSMGGRLALYLTVYYPVLWRKVILESASPGLKTQDERKQRLDSDRNLAKKLQNEKFNNFVDFWYEQPLFYSIKNNKGFPDLINRRLKNDPLALAKSLKIMGTGKQPSLWNKLNKIKLPMLLLAGQFDTKFKDVIKEMNLLCNSAEVKIVKGCGHNIHFEDQESFLRIVKDFIKN